MQIDRQQKGLLDKLAALAAEGESRITGLLHIDRGYEALEQDLAALGADIRRETL